MARGLGWIAWALLPIAVAIAAVPGCGRDDALVGGSCASGYVPCGDRCVVSDEANCGGCGVVCAERSACVAGRCTWPDGEIADAVAPDATPDGTATGDADATGDDDGPSEANADGSAADAPGNADGADATAADATPADAADADGASDDGADAAVQCAAGQQVCADGCTDLTSDPYNCGACGNVCPSQLCSQSACIGTTPGSLVFIGHDYRSTPQNTAQARVLANSVLLGPPRGPALNDIEVLSYERYADARAVARVQAILAAYTPAGRTLHITSTQTDADVAGLSFATYSVLLVPDQPNAQGDVDLGALGGSWANALSAFTQAGGIVVVLDGGTGAGQMPALVTGTGLLAVTAQAPLPSGTPIDVWAPGDAVGVGVVSPYAAGTNSVTVTTEANGGNVTYVVTMPTDAALSPVVVHKVF
jgi:hypothetical protein